VCVCVCVRVSRTIIVFRPLRMCETSVLRHDEIREIVYDIARTFLQFSDREESRCSRDHVENGPLSTETSTRMILLRLRVYRRTYTLPAVIFARKRVVRL